MLCYINEYDTLAAIIKDYAMVVICSCSNCAKRSLATDLQLAISTHDISSLSVTRSVGMEHHVDTLCLQLDALALPRNLLGKCSIRQSVYLARTGINLVASRITRLAAVPLIWCLAT